MRFYQVGGYRSDLHWFKYDDKKLSEAIAGPSSPLRLVTPLDRPIELVLGITSFGSSHLLLTADQMNRIASTMRLKRPSNRNDPLVSKHFESLSPIYFSNAKELEEKLSSLTPKASKKGKGIGQTTRYEDTSKANRGYSPAWNNPGRGAFEHGRVFYRILNDKIIPQLYGVQHTPWIKEIEIFSFVYNTLGIDNRPREERLLQPKVIDIGICNATLPSLLPSYSSARHIFVRENSLLGAKGKRLPFQHGETETLDHEALSQTIADTFRGRHSPSILLVNSAEDTLSYLKSFDVDTSEWRTDLKELLYPVEPRSSRTSNVQYNVWNRRIRSRSSSPHRGGSQYDNSSSASPSHDSGPYIGENQNWRPSYAPIYVVDVKQWYKVLMQREDVKRSIDIALRMKLTETAGWCAGNEAVFMIEAWQSMISGAAIDEQRDMRNKMDPPTGEDDQHTSLPSTTQSEADSDEEEDPNISMAKAKAAMSVQGPPEPSSTGGMDLEMSDYGSDDE